MQLYLKSIFLPYNFIFTNSNKHDKYYCLSTFQQPFKHFLENTFGFQPFFMKWRICPLKMRLGFITYVETYVNKVEKDKKYAGNRLHQNKVTKNNDKGGGIDRKQ